MEKKFSQWKFNQLLNIKQYLSSFPAENYGRKVCYFVIEQ